MLLNILRKLPVIFKSPVLSLKRIMHALSKAIAEDLIKSFLFFSKVGSSAKS